MTNLSLLGPRGTPMVELGGERAWRQYPKGDMVCNRRNMQLEGFQTLSDTVPTRLSAVAC